MPAKVKMELVGLNGNAFNLLAHFRQAARHKGWTAEAIQAVTKATKLSGTVFPCAMPHSFDISQLASIC